MVLFLPLSPSRLPIWMKEREKKRRRDVENNLERSKVLYSDTIMRRKSKKSVNMMMIMEKENEKNGSNDHFHFYTPIVRRGWKVYREIRAISQDTMVSKRPSRLRHGCNLCWFDFTEERKGGRGYS